MPESLHLPMTYDRDSEIMQHATLSNHLKINIWRYYNAKQVIMQFPREVQEILDRSLKSN
jgi:hypothetical protein